MRLSDSDPWKLRLGHFKDSKFEMCKHFLKWSDFGLVTEQVVFDVFRHQSVTEQVENDLFRHRQDHFQKYDYALGFLFALRMFFCICSSPG